MKIKNILNFFKKNELLLVLVLATLLLSGAIYSYDIGAKNWQRTIFSSFAALSFVQLMRLVSFRFAAVGALFYSLVFLGGFLFPALYCAKYGGGFGELQFDAVWQTDVGEALNYIFTVYFSANSGADDRLGASVSGIKSFALSFLYVFCFISSLIVAIRLKPVEYTRQAKMIWCLVCVGLIAFGVGRFEKSFLGRAVASYTLEERMLEAWQANVEYLKKAPLSKVAKKEMNDEVMLVVIGESLASHHMGVYGYFRNTTPRLNAIDDLTVFTDAISSYTQTNPSLQMSLTSWSVERGRDRAVAEYLSEDPDLQLAPMSSSATAGGLDVKLLMNELRSAGVETWWISNQGRLGPWGSFVAAQAELADHVMFGDTERETPFSHDEDLLKPLKAALLEKTGKSKVIFLHLIGSHWKYSNCYPKDWPLVTPSLSPALVGDLISNDALSEVDDYDRSVNYTDYVLSEAIRLLRSSAKVSSFVFFSDHGESVWNRMAHDGGRYYSMYEIPFIVWTSDAYAKRYPEVKEALNKNKDEPFVTDDVFHVALDLAKVKSDSFEITRSVVGKGFKPKTRVVVSNSGRENYDASRGEKVPFTRRQLARLPITIRSKMIAGSVDSVAAGVEAAFAGFKGVQLDVEIEGGGLFVVASSTLNGRVPLESWLPVLKKMSLVHLRLISFDSSSSIQANDELSAFWSSNNLQSDLIVGIDCSDSSSGAIGNGVIKLVKLNSDTALTQASDRAPISEHPVVFCSSRDYEQTRQKAPVEASFVVNEEAIVPFVSRVDADPGLSSWLSKDRVKAIIVPYRSELFSFAQTLKLEEQNNNPQ